ncbi:3-hydroxypropionyl-coenzyme A dehydratase [Candidatus Lokiarchaeum ossiferum]|uniref:3-hydroxypropionyl-coenzyme A dehydratase n=1 Tax=Candidatus Lokiarchaeum ossiferum TaxID=2951803 RepID=A0ABY6HT33_9ARCH|nr:3-hydroxypropionyl-coenzyme A dehydratase [Candidatus Lokiarchaeum sp. B-35]
MDLKNIIYKEEDFIGFLSINRPKAMNALNMAVLDELSMLIEKIQAENRIRALIITGEGKAFVAGADVSEIKELPKEEGRRIANKGSTIFRRIELLNLPVIAAVNGFALGGGLELALSCDIRIASLKAQFGLPEVGLGIIPGYGGTQRLPRLIGEGLAKEMIFTGAMVNAEKALQIGLVNNLVSAEKLMETAIALAQKILRQGPIAVRCAKRAIDQGMNTTLDNGLKIENDQFTRCYATNDQREGMSAFLEKRKANFTGLE